MSAWKGRLRSSSAIPQDTFTTMDLNQFKLSFTEALSDASTIRALQTALQPLFTPLHTAIQQLTEQNSRLKQQNDEKEALISSLTDEIEVLKIAADDQEQQGRKGSMRVFGLPEDTQGQVDEKVLQMITGNLELPLTIQDIEVAHRLGKPPLTTLVRVAGPAGPDGVPPQMATLTPNPDGTLPAQRPVIVKFVSRRIKAQVMKARTKLKDNPYLDAAHKPAKVFLCDDLTKRRAHLAFLARKLKQDSFILDTWVFDSRIFVKDKHNRVTRINNEQDLRKF